MVECDIGPSVLIMTDLTVSLGIVLWFDDPLMNILVTIPAIDTNIPEAPFLLLFMTIKTRYGLMRTFKREGRLVMLFNCKCKECESL